MTGSRPIPGNSRLAQRGAGMPVHDAYGPAVPPPSMAATGAAEPLMRGVHEARTEHLYRRMRFIRRFEETLLEMFEGGLLNGTTHACIGQEADAVGVLEHVEPGDHVFSNHRCHGHYLALT